MKKDAFAAFIIGQHIRIYIIIRTEHQIGLGYLLSVKLGYLNAYIYSSHALLRRVEKGLEEIQLFFQSHILVFVS